LFRSPCDRHGAQDHHHHEGSHRFLHKKDTNGPAWSPMCYPSFGMPQYIPTVGVMQKIRLKFFLFISE
ncbi:MAG TPA: hypothetical protein PKH10_07385, partial [bacterium]|nr:hypothetical protein [bacterium]